MKHHGADTFAIQRMAWTLTRFPVNGRTPMKAAKLACAVLQLGETERRGHLAALPYPARLQVAKALATESYEWVKTSWQVAEVAARAALGAVETPGPASLDAVRYDLLAEATAALANALRVGGDHFAARSLWSKVWSYQAQGRHEPRLVADLRYVESALHRGQRRFPEAVALLEQAIATYNDLGALHETVRASLVLSTVHLQAGDVQRAFDTLKATTPALTQTQDERLRLDWTHNFLHCVAELVSPWVALSLFDRALPLYQSQGAPLFNLRAYWFLGKLTVRIGAPERAAELFADIRQRFLDRGMSYDAALIALDEAHALLQAHRNLECADLARAMVGVFEALQIDREATAALLLFAEAAKELRATAELVLEAKRLLESSGRAVSRGED